ncbi:hypothetical protein LINPERHAP1_LOCUS14924 [Linum perenne]
MDSSFFTLQSSFSQSCLHNLVSFYGSVEKQFRNMASSSRLSDFERIMYKMKKHEEEDLFVYEGGLVECKCGLRPTRFIAYNLERYFGCPREKEGKSCGFYEKLEVREAVDAVTKEKDEVIERQRTSIRRLRERVKGLDSHNSVLQGYINALVKGNRSKRD